MSSKEYYIKNRVSILAMGKKWRLANKEKKKHIDKIYREKPLVKERAVRYNKQYRLDNPEKIAELKIKWAKENPVKTKMIKAKWRNENRTKIRTASYKHYRKSGKNKYLIDTYGITQEQYNGMVVLQNGLCAICNKCETQVNRSGELYELSVDHNHNTGKIRELLCKKCNLNIGLLKDDINYISVIIKYLDKHK